MVAVNHRNVDIGAKDLPHVCYLLSSSCTNLSNTLGFRSTHALEGHRRMKHWLIPCCFWSPSSCSLIGIQSFLCFCLCFVLFTFVYPSPIIPIFCQVSFLLVPPSKIWLLHFLIKSSPSPFTPLHIPLFTISIFISLPTT